MLRAGTLVTAAAGVALLAACSDGDITATPNGAPTAAVTPGDIVVIEGTWNWSNVEEVAFPPFVAQFLNIIPEGDLTHGHCESTGTMMLLQTGASFDGTAERVTNACLTEGGQPFNQPGTSFAITDGRITGGSVHFSFAAPPATPCPHHAVISVASDGNALVLSGAGRCILPGHPLSGSPFPADPPPQGRSRTTSWQAVQQ